MSVKDEVEDKRQAHFEKYHITPQRAARNFQMYSPRFFMRRFLAHYELFRLKRVIGFDSFEGFTELHEKDGIQPWEGESRAVDEFFEGKGIEIKRFDWSGSPGGYVVHG